MTFYLSQKIYTSLKISALFLLLLSLSGCFEPPPYTNLDSSQLDTMLKKGGVIYDVRRPDEWRSTGVVRNSKLLTFVDANGRLNPKFIERFTAEVGKDEPVILICRTGNRTNVLARHLIENYGYTQIYNVQNGIVSWISDDKPVVKARL